MHGRRRADRTWWEDRPRGWLKAALWALVKAFGRGLLKTKQDTVKATYGIQRVTVMNLTVLAFALWAWGAGKIDFNLFGVGIVAMVFVLAILVYALVCLTVGNRERTIWIKRHFTAIGLFGTGLGFALALRHTDFTAADQSKALADVLQGAGFAIWSMVTAIGSFVYLSFALSLTATEPVARDE